MPGKSASPAGSIPSNGDIHLALDLAAESVDLRPLARLLLAIVQQRKDQREDKLDDDKRTVT